MLKKSTNRRSRSGCLTCRARKVKCDSNYGVCGNCRRLQEICRRGTQSGDSLSPTLDHTPETLLTFTKAGMKRRRTLTSCQNCRLLKRKCSGERPACHRCQEKKLVCIFDDNLKAASPQSPHLDSPNLPSEDVQLPVMKFLQNRTTQLPDKVMIRTLVEKFFAEIYPCRMFGFIHKPSFMIRLEQGFGATPEEEALLLSMCALGTKCNYSEAPQLWEIGVQWARQAHHLLTDSYNTISISNLMTVILLHEHDFRSGKLGSCFLLSGMAARMAQALQINLEYDLDVLCDKSTMSCTEKECRRRLLWACYFLDTASSSGVKQLSLIDENDIKIQLPCSEDNFLFQRPCITETITPGEVLKFINIFDQAVSPSTNMDYRAHYVRIVRIRNKVLSYVKRFMEDEDPWSPTSEFSEILSDLATWKLNFPSDLNITPSIIYIRKDQGLLSTLFHIHLLYHLCFCDLYRIVMPGLSYPKSSSIEAIQIAAPIEFLVESQDACYEHACAMSDIFQKSLDIGSMSFTDPGIAIAAHEATRVQVLYITQLATDRMNQEKMSKAIRYLETNLLYLQAVSKRMPMVCRMTCSAEKVILKSQLPVALTGRYSSSRESSPEPATDVASQISPDYKLHPLSSFSAMRESIAEKHAPQSAKYSLTHPMSSPESALDMSLFSSMMSSGTDNWLFANQQGVLF